MDHLSTKLWFKTDLDLDKVCCLIQRELKLDDFDFDAENHYEWREARAQDGSWKINISRKHDCGVSLPEEVYHVYFGGYPGNVKEVAQQIATIIDREVHLGKIIYLGGDDYEYR